MVLIQSALHVVFDTPSRDALLTFGIERVVCATDSLLVGPCHPDPVRHHELRTRYRGGAVWNEREFDAAALAARPQVVLWASRSWIDELGLWRACDLLRPSMAGTWPLLARSSVAHAAPWSHGSTSPPDGACMGSMADGGPDGLRSALAGAKPLGRRVMSRLASLWRAFASSSPAPFSAEVRRATHDRQLLSGLWSYYSGFFPRVSTGDALRLSVFDELVLSSTSEEWRTPIEIIANAPDVEELWRWLSCTGDLMLPRRLDEWTGRGVEAKDVPGATGPMSARAYRLTSTGLKLLASGLSSIGDAPPMPVGGALAYTGRRPWAWKVREGAPPKLVQARDGPRRSP